MYVALSRHGCATGRCSETRLFALLLLFIACTSPAPRQSHDAPTDAEAERISRRFIALDTGGTRIVGDSMLLPCAVEGPGIGSVDFVFVTTAVRWLPATRRGDTTSIVALFDYAGIAHSEDAGHGGPNVWYFRYAKGTDTARIDVATESGRTGIVCFNYSYNHWMLESFERTATPLLDPASRREWLRVPTRTRPE